MFEQTLLNFNIASLHNSWRLKKWELRSVVYEEKIIYDGIRCSVYDE